MSGKIVVVYPNGTTTEEDYVGAEPELEKLQGHVQGWIEAIPGMVKFGSRLCVAYVNEEGLLRELPFNPAASRLVRGQRIVGNMVIVVPLAQEAKAG